MILGLKHITKDFPVERGIFRNTAGSLRAVDNLSLTLDKFQTLGIVGESGSGKTTLAKIITGLIPATSGEISFDRKIITSFRKDVQIIFQNPLASLNPKMRIKDALAEPLLIHGLCRRKDIPAEAARLLEITGLNREALERYPAELSGGQRQRVCIARALACRPKLLILDEPLSSLDLTIQAKLLDLFAVLKAELGLTYIFISHNLAVIKHIADCVAVMKDGKIIEEGGCQKIFQYPEQDYTRLLIKSAA